MNRKISDFYPELKGLVYDFSFYEGIFRRLVCSLNAIKGVESVYRIGSWSAPGNSDIDFVIFVENKTYIRNVITVFEGLNSIEKFVAYQHPPMVLPKSLKKWVSYIRPVDKLISLDGEVYKPEEIDNDSLYHSFIELLLTYYPKLWFVLSTRCKNVLDQVYKPWEVVNVVRHVLQSVNAFRFVIDIYRQLFDEVLNVVDWDNLQEIRKNYLDMAATDVCFYYFELYPKLQVYTLYLYKKVIGNSGEHRIVWVGDRIFLSISRFPFTTINMRWDNTHVNLWYLIDVSIYDKWKNFKGIRRLVMDKYVAWMKSIGWWGMYSPFLYRYPHIAVGGKYLAI